MQEPMLGCRARRARYGTDPDPYWDYVMLLMNMETGFVDLSKKGRVVTKVGSVANPVQSRNSGGMSLQPLDTSSGLVVAGSQDFAYPAGTDFTIEAWMYTYTTRQFKQIVGQWGSTNAYQMSIYGDNFGWETPGGGTRSGTTVTLNSWHHLAVCRQGSTLRLFQNGTKTGEYTDTYNYAFTDAIGLGISKVAPQNGYSAMEAYIDEVRITKGIARYTANFGSPVEMFPNF